jgi:prepilin-type N-terminal cleavage/methylation domain-containing protein
MERSKGFTLIELLVVIAIIGLLASIILASLNTAQQKGRDARRISDLKEIQLALELYYDANSTYPIQSTAIVATPAAASGAVITSSNNFGLVPTYISTTPIDPSQPSGGGASAYYYQYESLQSDGVTACSTGSCPAYVLVGHLEAGANTSTWTGGNASWLTLCPSGGGSTSPYSYCVHS